MLLREEAISYFLYFSAREEDYATVVVFADL